MLMSRKNHKMEAGKLLRTDKQFRHLKQSQKEKINEWLYQEYRTLWLEQNRQPSSMRNGEILVAVMEKELLKKGKDMDMAENQLSVETIQGAVAGDQDAVQKVIEHYSDYIDDFGSFLWKIILFNVILIKVGDYTTMLAAIKVI